ncbi:MAG: AAA family ATPase [Phycisphaerales bacterium]
MDTQHIRHLTLRNYKSIESCSIDLAPLTIFVGRNGVGKSNILDALRFVAESLSTTLEFAIRERGGIDLVRRKSLGGRPTHPGVRLEIKTSTGSADYAFRIAAVSGFGFRVDEERCRILDAHGRVLNEFAVEDEKVTKWTLASASPAVSPDRLFLVAASGQPQFREVWDILRRMTFHNLNPEAMKLPSRPEPGELLAPDGHNIASVVKHLRENEPDELDRVLGFMRAIGVPLAKVSHKQAGALETIEVSQLIDVEGGVRNSNFDAASLSDGTLRALGILVSLASASAKSNRHTGPSLIGIEEPETALHPAAAGALMEALVEGSERTQLLLSCHSPDLVDHPRITAEMIRPVVIENGKTMVGRLGNERARLLREHLSTAGELLRLDQLSPDPEDIKRQAAQGSLFEGFAS